MDYILLIIKIKVSKNYYISLICHMEWINKNIINLYYKMLKRNNKLLNKNKTNIINHFKILPIIIKISKIIKQEKEIIFF
jgi:hypothetical protein